MTLLLIFSLAVGLSFDSFAVSLGTGTVCSKFSWRSLRFATILALMQAIMPTVGWFAVGEFHSHIAIWDHWIAFGLLLLLGGKMVIAGLKDDNSSQKKCDPLSLKNSLIMGLATSIDALIAGAALALVKIEIVPGGQLVNMLMVVFVIFAVTMLASVIGLVIGRGMGRKLGARAEIIGGVILVLIGGKVLYEHLTEPTPCLDNEQQQTQIICFNIRYDNPDDQQYGWHARRESILSMVESENPAILGIQEGLTDQIRFLDSALIRYTYIGVGRDDGKQKGEYTAIFFDTTRVDNLRSGNFWLCPTPNLPVIGWDAACVRMATWGEFMFKHSVRSQKFLVVNTHFDHIGTVARTESGRQIIETIDSLAAHTPLVLMGDFNCQITDSSLRPILRKMSDSRPPNSPQPSHTYIGFGDLSIQVEVIDHIFTRSMQTNNYRIITDSFGSPCGQLSDHLPVSVNITLL